MTGKLKALGLALVAVFAMSAIAATAAQAKTTVLEAGSNPAFLTGEQEGLHVFDAGTRDVSCNTAIFDGEIKGVTEKVTATPTYSDCFATPGGFDVTVTMEGCDYTFYGGAETVGNPHHFDKGTVDLKCPPNKTPSVHIYSGEGHTNNICTIDVTPFVGKHNNTLENKTPETGKKDVTLTSNVTGIDIHITGSQLLCGTATTATYTGATTIRAYSDKEPHKTQVDLTVKTLP